MLPTWKWATRKVWYWTGSSVLTALLTLHAQAGAQDRTTSGSSGASGATTGTANVQLQTGAPRPATQSPGIVAPLPPAGAPPAPPAVKVGGGIIIAAFFPFGLEEDSKMLGLPTRKNSVEVFRASFLLDSKIDRFGVHIDFRFRDKRGRGYWHGTTWMDEIYGSVDFIRPESEWGPLTLKVGKTYKQFGMFWDNTFVGNVMLRDGIKIDPNYGLSLEGVIGARTRFGAKYFAQYYVLDGAPNTSIDARDTISNPAPYSGYPMDLARRRNMFNGRIEPFFNLTPVIGVKLGGSIENFTADFGPTKDQRDVLRYGADAVINLAWFSLLGEYVWQKGAHTLIHPFNNSPAIGMGDIFGRAPRAARTARFSEDIRYAVVGGKISYKMITLRYNWSRADYLDIPYPYADGLPPAVTPTLNVHETIQVPGATIGITPQLFLMVEYLQQNRFIGGVPRSAFRGPLAGAAAMLEAPSAKFLLDRQFVVTLHGRM